MIDKKIIEKLKNGEVGILPTDTIYGLVGLALSSEAVERIYELRKRDPKKPMIILIGELSDLKKFDIKIDKKVIVLLKKYWPGKVSIILPCKNDKFLYLHRGTKSLAFRLPADQKLRKLLKQTGPLVAPSANIEAKKSADNIAEAKKYFGDRIDFYIDAGRVESKPSTLIRIENGKIIVIRKGWKNIS